MTARSPKDIAAIVKDQAQITAALAAGVREAMVSHVKAGLPMVESRDGKIVWIEPAEIERRIEELDEKSGK